MADNTSIEWARHPVSGKRASWNPVLARTKALGLVGYHCEHVSPGCQFCYAESHNQRKLPKSGTGLQFKPGHRDLVDIFLDEEKLIEPLHWRAPRGIFVCSMTDLFGSFVPNEMLDRIFAVMALAPRHIFMVLTKRPDRMREYLADPNAARRIYELACDLVLEHEIKVVLIAPGIDEAHAPAGERIHLGQWPLPNVWLGTSAEDQERANERIPQLLETPAAVRFLSAEPLLDHLDLDAAWHGESALEAECWGDCAWCAKGHLPLHNCRRGLGDWLRSRSGIDWVIAGFESGRQARLAHDTEKSIAMLRATGAPLLVMTFEHLVLRPAESARIYARFVGAELDVDAMAKVVMRRNPRCLPGMIEEGHIAQALEATQ